jgi:hypothetical protein
LRLSFAIPGVRRGRFPISFRRGHPGREAGIPVNDFTAGSTTWRFEAADGQYIFNLKTGTSTPWDIGTWTTTVSYAGIPLATTQFDFRS